MKQQESETNIAFLLRVMAILRDPEKGCPWDKKQTFSSIAPYTLEETYEVLDAIERGKHQDLRDELGDLLFQVVFYAQMAKEQGLFNFDDICHAISHKLIFRHPHVFNAKPVDSINEIKVNWEERKSQERQQKELHSVLDDIPNSLPALMKAHKIQQRCATVGFDWHEFQPVLDKLYEEIDEVLVEVNQPEINQEKLEEELGDLLFASVNLTRHLGHKAEIALQKANKKFERRFRLLEAQANKQGKPVNEMSLAEMDKLWEQVKQIEQQQTK